MASLLFHYCNFDSYRASVTEMRAFARDLEDLAILLVTNIQEFLIFDTPYDAPSALRTASIVRATIRPKYEYEVYAILAERDFLMNDWHNVKSYYITFATALNDLTSTFNDIYGYIMDKVKDAFRNMNVLNTDLLQCKDALDGIQRGMSELHKEHQLIIDIFKIMKDEMWTIYNFQRLVTVAGDGTKTMTWQFEFPMPIFLKEQESNGGRRIDLVQGHIGEYRATSKVRQEITPGVAVKDVTLRTPGSRRVHNLKINIYQTGPVTTMYESPTSSRVKTRSSLAKRKVGDDKIQKKKKKETKNSQNPSRKSVRISRITDEELDAVVNNSSPIACVTKRVSLTPDHKATILPLSSCPEKKRSQSPIKRGSTLGAKAPFLGAEREVPIIKVDPPTPPVGFDGFEWLPAPPPISVSKMLPSGERLVEIDLLLRPRLNLDTFGNVAELYQDTNTQMSEAGPDPEKLQDQDYHYGMTHPAYQPVDVDLDDGATTSTEPATPCASAVSDCSDFTTEVEDEERSMRSRFGGFIAEMFQKLDRNKPKPKDWGKIEPKQMGKNKRMENIPMPGRASDEKSLEYCKFSDGGKRMDALEILKEFDEIAAPIPHSIAKSAFEDPKTGIELPTARMSAGGASRARHAHDRDPGPLGDGPRKVTVYVNPSKRPYVAPFRRVQTLERLMQYISTLPHPQIRFVTSANPAKPKFKACEELLFAGQWQLVDKSGCIIRPEDWEELVHDGMDITVDTMVYEAPAVETHASLLQPMAISGRKDVSVAASQFGSMEVAGDLMEIQSALEPAAARQRAAVSAPRLDPSRLFVPQYPPEPEPLAMELEGDDNPEPQASQPNTFVMPPKPAPWTFKKPGMSPSAMEFKPSGGFNSTIEPDDNPIFRGRKRSMAIPIIKPPSPPETIVAASKPDIPDATTQDTHETASYAKDTHQEAAKEEEEDDGWGGRVAVTAELTEEQSHPRQGRLYHYRGPSDDLEESAGGIPASSEEGGEWDGGASTTSLTESSHVPGSTGGEAHLAPPDEDEEVASVSETVVASGPKSGERSAASNNGLSTEDEGTTHLESTGSPSIDTESKFEGESHLFDDDSPAPGDSESQRNELGSADARRHGIPVIVSEPPRKTADERPQAPQELESSVQKLRVIMATSGGQPRAELEPEPRLRAMGFRWSEEPYEQSGQVEVKQEPEQQNGWWGTPAFGPEATTSNNEPSWGDWSIPATAPGYASQWEAQWDNRGHVPLPEDNDSEWAPKKPAQPVVVASRAADTGNNRSSEPQKPAWATVASLNSAPGHMALPTKPAAMAAAMKKGIAPKHLSGQAAPIPFKVGSKAQSIINAGPYLPKGPKKVLVNLVAHLVAPRGSATKTAKVSLGTMTTIRKIAQMYARTHKDNVMLAASENLNMNPVFELSVSKTEGGPVTCYMIEADKRLDDYDFGTEFWLSVVYSFRPAGNSKKH
ncbi:hypothetical protein Dda_5321 [Drechslerella dactyloides]|uniref:Uncharacterized protein n=1 Tax=Drechslerella dactyloides TaxID=74499 RepID=A0AAD6IVV8_DREDA|nr:hypothetical protein Dda_5321 [Drechslerella dactyloides]